MQIFTYHKDDVESFCHLENDFEARSGAWISSEDRDQYSNWDYPVQEWDYNYRDKVPIRSLVGRVLPCWVPDNEELVMKALSQLLIGKWNTFASKELQKIEPDMMPEELQNYRITAFNEIKGILNVKSNDTKYFNGFFDNAEYSRFLKEISLQLFNLALDVNLHRLQRESYQMGYDWCQTESWFDLDDLKIRFSGYALPYVVAARKPALEKEPEVWTIFQKKAEQNLLDLPLAARIQAKRQRNQPGNTKRRPGEKKGE